MQLKIWFIKVDGKREGPFSLKELKIHPHLNPDTMVWREGYKDWVRARDVLELKSLFEDEDDEDEQKKHDEENIKSHISAQDDEGALVLEGSNLPFLFYWLIILLLVFSYVFYRLYGS